MRAKQVLVMVLLGLFTLAVGFGLFTVLVNTVEFLWHAEPGSLWPDGPPAWFTVGLLLLAGAAVYGIRAAGANGHGPLAGLELAAVPPRQYPGVVGAIAVSMVCAIALGPEAALLATGGLIGGVAARRFGLPEKRAVLWASLWALGALFLGPFLRGSVDMSADYQLAWSDLVLAPAAGLVTAGVLTLVRLIARPLQGIQPEGRPVLWLLLVGGAAIGAVGVVYHNVTGQPVDLALTSGEQMIKTLLGLGTVGAIVAAVSAKAVVYAISLGAGFRGGAYFPALFVGAGCGAALAMQFDGSVPAGATAGLVASVTYLSQVRWGAVAVLAVVIGWMAGGWALLPVSLVAAVAGRLVPRVDPPEALEGNQRQSAAAGAPPA